MPAQGQAAAQAARISTVIDANRASCDLPLTCVAKHSAKVIGIYRENVCRVRMAKMQLSWAGATVTFSRSASRCDAAFAWSAPGAGMELERRQPRVEDDRGGCLQRSSWFSGMPAVRGRRDLPLSQPPPPDSRLRPPESGS